MCEAFNGIENSAHTIFFEHKILNGHHWLLCDSVMNYKIGSHGLDSSKILTEIMFLNIISSWSSIATDAIVG